MKRAHAIFRPDVGSSAFNRWPYSRGHGTVATACGRDVTAKATVAPESVPRCAVCEKHRRVRSAERDGLLVEWVVTP
jgi:hypothetical protein